MAINFVRRAPNHCFVYNPVFWVVSSTQTAQENFHLICDIYITGQTFAGASYLRLRYPVDPTNNRIVVNVNSVLERYLTYDINVASAGQEAVKQATNSIIEYELHFGEEYGPSSGVTVFADLFNTGSNYAHNAVLDHLDYINFINTSGSAFLNPAGTSKRFLTNEPRKATSPYIPIRANEHQWLQIINNVTSPNNSARVKYEFFDSTFQVLNATVIVNNNYSSLANTADRRLIVPVGYNIDDILSTDIISGTLPQVSSASNIFWKVKMVDSSNNQVSEEFIFQKDPKCTPHTEYRLHFMNEFGAFDSFTFTRAEDFETDIKERKIFSKPGGKFNSLIDYMYEAKDQLDIVYYTELKDGIKLRSDWISEAVYRWLDELVASPVVYAENITWSSSASTFTLVPVRIEDKKFKRKKRITDRLFNLEITIRPTYDRYRQRG